MFNTSRMRLVRGEGASIRKTSAYSARGSALMLTSKSTDVMFVRTFERICSDSSPWTCRTLKRVAVAFVVEAVSGGGGSSVVHNWR